LLDAEGAAETVKDSNEEMRKVESLILLNERVIPMRGKKT
jgi:hypothetical protein